MKQDKTASAATPTLSQYAAGVCGLFSALSADLWVLMMIFLVSSSPQGAGAFLTVLTHSVLVVLP